MRRYVRIVLLGLLFAVPASGCGCGTKGPDNSNIQTPNDQPLGNPKPMGGDGDQKQPKGRTAPL